MKISVVTLTRNRLLYLRRLYQSLARNTTNIQDIEWIVVDNGSTDGTREWLTDLQLPSFLKFIVNPDNSRNMIARNDGIEIAHGEYIAQIDDDAFVLKDWDIRMLKYIDEDKNILAVGQEGNYCRPDWSNYFRPGLKPGVGQECDFLTGYCWMWKNQPSLLYDENFLYIHEETDLQFQMKLKYSYKFVRCEPVAIHTSQKIWTPGFTKKWDERNIELIKSKYWGDKVELERGGLLTYGETKRGKNA